MESDNEVTLNRAIWTIVWFALLAVGTSAWGSWATWSGYDVVGPVITFAGVAGLLLVWLIPSTRSLLLARVTFAAALGSILLQNGPMLATKQLFTTDAEAFNQRATTLLLRGVDPYEVTFHRAHLLVDQTVGFWTYLLNGGHVDQFSYPAGALVIQAPIQWLGLHHMTVDWVDLFAWIAAAVILYLVSPAREKWLSPLLLLLSTFSSLFAFGGTDALFVPFLMIAVLRWDDFVRPDAPAWAHWVGPIALGVACSIKQTPWFTVPFLVIGIAFEARHQGVSVTREVARYLALVLGAFLAIDLPFMIWNLSSWWHGTFLPLTQPLIPDGQGLVSLATHGFAHVVHPSDLQLAGVFLLAALAVAMVTWYPQMKGAWLFALPVIFYVPSRSLSSYLVDFVPIGFVALLTTAPAQKVRRGVRHLSWRVGAVVALSVVAVVSAVAAFLAPPLSIKVDAYGPARNRIEYSDLVVTLVNHTDAAISPHLMVVVGADHPVGFWKPVGVSGAYEVPADATVTTMFSPPADMWVPREDETWLVEVLSAKPAALTTSRIYRWPYKNG